MEQDFRKRFFWPLMAAFVGAVLLLMMTDRDAEVVPTALAMDQPGRPFDLLISTLVTEQQNLELLDIEFEHWQKQTVSVNLLTPGLIRTELLAYLPDTAVKELLDTHWNKSEAQIITHCKASVELEVPVKNIDQWKITIDGDSAHVHAPAIQADRVNIEPASISGWIIDEDWLIDGEKKRKELMASIHPHLQKKVHSQQFKRSHREACRRSLCQVMKKLINLAMAESNVRHVDVLFAGE